MWPLAELPYGQEEVENGCGGTARHLTLSTLFVPESTAVCSGRTLERVQISLD